jgi:hypothetical protein
MVDEDTYEITCAYCKHKIQGEGLVVDSLELGHVIYCDEICMSRAIGAESMTQNDILKDFGIEEEEDKEEVKEDYFGLDTWRDAVHASYAK